MPSTPSTKLFFAAPTSSLSAAILHKWTKDETKHPLELVKPDDEYARTINPTGALPALQLSDGSVLTENVAILQYLARRAGATALLGGDKLEDQAQVMRWSSFLAADVHPAFRVVFFSPRFATDDADGAKEAGLKIVNSKLVILESHMKGREWVVGSERTLVDAQIAPMLDWSLKVLPDGLKAYPNLTALRERLLADEDVQKARAEHGIEA